MLTEVLAGPAMLAGAKGDIWVADHVTREAPTLARNLVRASEYSPGLRSQLERAISGESDFGKMFLMVAVAEALAAYALPVVIYYLGDRAPKGAREAFGVPAKPPKEPPPNQEYVAPWVEGAVGPNRSPFVAPFPEDAADAAAS